MDTLNYHIKRMNMLEKLCRLLTTEEETILTYHKELYTQLKHELLTPHFRVEMLVDGSIITCSKWYTSMPPIDRQIRLFFNHRNFPNATFRVVRR